LTEILDIKHKTVTAENEATFEVHNSLMVTKTLLNL